MQIESPPQESFAVVGLCVWVVWGRETCQCTCSRATDNAFSFSAIASWILPPLLLSLGGNSQIAALYQIWTPNPPSCLCKVIEVKFAWSAIILPTRMHQMWAKHEQSEMLFMLRITFQPRVKICKELCCVQSLETFNFGSWRYLSFCHFND